MTFAPSAQAQSGDLVLRAHPVYTVRLNKFLDGRPLGATLKKVGWMSLLRDRHSKLACVEVSIISGRHKNPRLSEGKFVTTVFRLVEKSARDSRLAGHNFALRFLRVESLHLFCLWLKVNRQTEYFIPVAPSGSAWKAGYWVSRKEFTQLLRSEGQRIRADQERMSRVLESHKD